MTRAQICFLPKKKTKERKKRGTTYSICFLWFRILRPFHFWETASSSSLSSTLTALCKSSVFTLVDHFTHFEGCSAAKKFDFFAETFFPLSLAQRPKAPKSRVKKFEKSIQIRSKKLFENLHFGGRKFRPMT